MVETQKRNREGQ